MTGVHALVPHPAGDADLLPQHAVVLHVVHDFQQREADDGLQDEVRQDSPAQPPDHRAPQHRRHQPRVEHVVADAVRVAVAAGVALLLQPPRALHRPGDGARPEPVEALADPRARGILRRRDTHVVASVVLDVEVAVEALRQRDLGQPALVALLLVPQLVRGVDADAADAADRHREPGLVHNGQILGRDHVERGDEPRVLDRQEQERDPAVVAVLFQRLDQLVRWVGAVQAGHQVEGGDDHQHDDRAGPQPDAPACQRVQAQRHEGERRHHQADQPQVALAVLPLLGRARCDSARHRALLVVGFTKP